MSKKKKAIDQLYIDRLLLLAKTLGDCKNYKLWKNNFDESWSKKVPFVIYERKAYFINYQFVYAALTVFEKWDHIQENGLLLYNLSVAMEADIVHFFSLSMRQYIKCFIPYCQGGTYFQPLTYKSKPKDLALNIYLLLQEIHPNPYWARRLVLTEKIPL